MCKPSRCLLLVPLALALCAGPACAQAVSLDLDPKQVVNGVDEKVYGHFLEHIFHSVNGGVWGGLGLERSFEDWSEPHRKGASKHPPAVGVARHWKFYGEGNGFRATDHPLNSASSQGIVSKGPEAGVAQSHFCIRKGETYHGILWARGTARDGLVVRLQQDGTPVEEVRLAAPTDEWRQYTFEFRPRAAGADATLQVGVRGTGTIELDQVRLTPQAALEDGGFRPDLLRAIAALKPPLIRWPGGTFAEHYRWKDAIGPQPRRE